MRAAALLAAAVALLVLAPGARSAPPPRHAAMVAVFAQWWQPADTQAREIAQLRAENRKLRRQLAAHGRWVRHLQRSLREQVRLGPFGVERGFMCIHPKEGSWRDPNPPFWGGVQMDLDFQRTYGLPFLQALGTADHWTPAMQIVTAERAYYSGRGWHPWPNTARYCGLL